MAPIEIPMDFKDMFLFLPIVFLWFSPFVLVQAIAMNPTIWLLNQPKQKLT